jgi:GT2 family glycosyltransferase
MEVGPESQGVIPAVKSPARGGSESDRNAAANDASSQAPSVGVLRGSLIVCTYRRDDVLVATLESLIRMCPPDCELLVVDQIAEHTPETRNFLETASSASRLRYFNLDEAGLTRARNFGAKMAHGQVLIFLDDDIIPGAKLIEAHLAAYEDPKVAAVAGQVLNLGEEQKFAPGLFVHTEQMKDFRALYGANFSIRRAVFIAIGGSDERLGVHSYTEDVLLASQIVEKGFSIVYEPLASIHHLLHPRGGCRITDATQPTREWEKSHSKLYLFHIQFRTQHLNRWQTLRDAVRHGPLRRENVVRPWRQPWAWVAFLRAFGKARRDSACS